MKGANNIKDRGVKRAIIAVNNDYAGFGSGTENRLRKLLGLSEAKWEDEEEEGIRGIIIRAISGRDIDQRYALIS